MEKQNLAGRSPEEITAALQDAVYNKGIAQITKLSMSTCLSEDQIRAAIGSSSAFHWLDEIAGYVWVEKTSENLLMRHVRKILCVAPQVELKEFSLAIHKIKLLKNHVLPMNVLQAFLEQSGFKVEAGIVSAAQSYPVAIFDRIESVLYATLKENGGVAHHKQLEEGFAARKMGDFGPILSITPIALNVQKGVWRLTGTSVAAETGNEIKKNYPIAPPNCKFSKAMALEPAKMAHLNQTRWH